MQVLIKAGKIRHVGLSNETSWGVMHALELHKTKGLPRIQSVQNPYNLLQRAWDINLAEVLMEVGYRGAVTTISGFNTVGTNPYLLHREITDASMPGWVFRARVYGNYDAVRFLKQQIKISSQGR